jgi:hypothetical protein
VDKRWNTFLVFSNSTIHNHHQRGMVGINHLLLLTYNVYQAITNP